MVTQPILVGGNQYPSHVYVELYFIKFALGILFVASGKKKYFVIRPGSRYLVRVIS